MAWERAQANGKDCVASAIVGSVYVGSVQVNRGGAQTARSVSGWIPGAEATGRRRGRGGWKGKKEAATLQGFFLSCQKLCAERATGKQQ